MQDSANPGITSGIFIPSFFLELGTSLSLTFNPLWARSLGANVAMVGLIAASEGLGSILFDIPAGWLAGKIRDRVFMASSLAGLALFALLKGSAAAPWHLLIITLFQGVLRSAWGIGRVAYIRRNVRTRSRGRTMSLLGGIMRASRIVSPALGGFIIQLTGFRFLYYTQFIFIAFALTLFMHISGRGQYSKPPEIPSKDALKSTFRKNGKNIAIAMTGIGGLKLLRMTRKMLFPLWAEYIGVSVALIGIITSIGGIVETLMAFPAGYISDRKGRKWTAVPSTLGFAVFLALLPLTGNFFTLTLVYMLIAVANGLGSGIGMTISSDLAPKEAASQFLGIWRFCTDGNSIAGPLMAGYIAGFFGMALSPLVVGGIGAASGLIMLFFMKETGKIESKK